MKQVAKQYFEIEVPKYVQELVEGFNYDYDVKGAEPGCNYSLREISKMKRWTITARKNDCSMDQYFYCEMETFMGVFDWFKNAHPDWHILSAKFETILNGDKND